MAQETRRAIGVTSQEKKDELRRYRDAVERAHELEDRIARVMARAEKTTAAYSGMPGGGGIDHSMECVVAQYEAMLDDLSGQLSVCNRLMKSTQTAIDGLDDGHMRRLMALRYLDGYKWETIADLMGFDLRWVFRLHGRALELVEIRH